jgi:quinol monooxygenase YgiN
VGFSRTAGGGLLGGLIARLPSAICQHHKDAVSPVIPAGPDHASNIAHYSPSELSAGEGLAFAAMIIVSGTLHVDPAERDAYLHARVPILEHARRAPGCLDFSLSADLLDAGRINVYEQWRSPEDLLAYRAGGGPDVEDAIEVTSADVELHHISASEAP